jgi:transposase InsO family protein
MDQKIQMIGDYLERKFTITQLSEMYGVSRNTIYKWIKRYKQGGNEGLTTYSAAPRRHPNATPIEIAREIVALKGKYRYWGPKKLTWWLKQHYPDRKWPAVSTAGNILKQAGLVTPRKKRQRAQPYTEPFLDCSGPNVVWSADYKGQFKTGDGQLCYPLTISDNYSRYLLCCQGLRHPSYEESRPFFEAVFREYGLPAAIRTDNGVPFASNGLGGLSKLSVWFIKLGIIAERIRAGHPEENGRHERKHKTLKAATLKPPKRNMQEQQKSFDKFTLENNNETPSEALGMQVPASYYQPSLRTYPKRIPKISYHGNYIVRQVRHSGEIKWKGEKVYVSQALSGEPIGLKPIGNNQWQIYFSTYCLGVLDELDMRIKTGEKVLTMSPV